MAKKRVSAEGKPAKASAAGGVAVRGLDVRFGLNLLVYTASFSKDKIHLISHVAELGYDAVEIPFTDLDALDAPAIRKACETAGVGVTSCCVLMPGENLCSPKASERKAGLARLKRMADLTAEMGGEMMAGPLYAPVRWLTGQARTQDEFDRCAEGLRAAAGHARGSDVLLAIEPLNRFETHILNTTADTLRLIEVVDNPNLVLQLDTFHANIEEKDTAAAIRSAGHSLRHFHACENDRGTPGTGQVKWKEVFAALKHVGYNGYLTIESFATGIADLCAAACIWRPIYKSADALAAQGLAFLKEMAGKTTL